MAEHESLYARARDIAEEEGYYALSVKGGQYLKGKAKSRFPMLRSNDPYQLTRVAGTEERWKMIEPHISPQDRSLLDIGCNAGLLTSYAARLGLISLGVEQSESGQKRAVDKTLDLDVQGFNHAIERAKEVDNVAFMRTTVTPDTIDAFPTFDVVFLLSVFHYWYRQYGKDDAKEMLSALGDSKRIFFEPASTQKKYTENTSLELTPPPITDFDEESIVDYNFNMLESTFGEGYRVEYLGSTSRGEDRQGDRYLFLIKNESWDE